MRMFYTDMVLSMHSSDLKEGAAAQCLGILFLPPPVDCLWMHTTLEYCFVLILPAAGEEDCARFCVWTRWPTEEGGQGHVCQ